MDFQTAPVVVTAIDNGFRLGFTGPIHTNTAWLETELQKVSDAKPKLVELDLSGTEFISSMGLGVLVGFRNAIVKGGGMVAIIGIQERTLRTFKAAHVLSLFDVR
jgi:anti-anti-sigma factor